MEESGLVKINGDIALKLFGRLDENMRQVEQLFDVKVSSVSEGLEVTGAEKGVKDAMELLSSLSRIAISGGEITRQTVSSGAEMVLSGKGEGIEELHRDAVAVTAKGKQIRCKTLGQKEYVKAIKGNTIVFGVGPAGTGKTYLAVAMAVAAYKAGEVEKIILTRPAIEAGEKLGFLPGDLQMKVDPYLRPLYDALSDMFGVDSYSKLIERGTVEIAPLAYMRGRTLSSAFIILDEAQNTTCEQMQMFLTRMGEGSKMVITGDVTQIDLPDGKKSGLIQAAAILKNIEGIQIMNLTEKDVVRHELVQRIVTAYAKNKTINNH